MFQFQFIIWFVCKDADVIQSNNEISRCAQINKSIYRPGDTEKTVKLSSQVSPENILHKQTYAIFRGNKKLKREKRGKKYKNKQRRYLLDETKSLFEHIKKQLQ